jgi:hypothetical protein
MTQLPPAPEAGEVWMYATRDPARLQRRNQAFPTLPLGRRPVRRVI